MQLEEIKTIVSITGTLVQITATVLAGIWTYRKFIRNRDGKVRVELAHDISHRFITSDTILLSVNVKVKNLGECLAEFEYIETWVQKAIPANSELLKIITSHKLGEPYKKQTDSDSWGMIGCHKREIKGQMLLATEPAEPQSIYTHFLVNADIRTVLITTHLKEVGEHKFKEDKQLEWMLETMYDFPVNVT